MKIVRYLKHSIPAVLLILLLLIVQAFCDLAIPKYTSEIVDVGIQQAGVEHIATDEMSADTYNKILMMLPSTDETLFEKSYTKEGENYRLTGYGESHRNELDTICATPLILIHNQEITPMLDLSQAYQDYQEGNLDKQKLLDQISQAEDSLNLSTDDLKQQQALAAAKAEYEKLGFDLSDMQMNYLIRVGVTMLLLAALGSLAAVAIGFLASRTGTKIGAELRSKLFSRVVAFSDAEVQSFSAASLITRGTNDIQQVQMVIIMMLRMVLNAPIIAIGGIIMVFQTSAPLTWIIAVAVIAVIALVMSLMFITMPKFQLVQKLIDRVNLVVREMLTGVPVIRAFGRQSFEQHRFEQANDELMRVQLFTNRVMTFMMPSMMLIMNVVSVAVIWFGGFYVDNGTLQTGDLIAFITYAMVIIASFLMIGMISIMLPRADVAAGRINDVLNTQPSIQDPLPQACQDEAFLASLQNGLTISFNDVSFRYNASSECILDAITFTAPHGKTTALIGSTGSGKSTVIKLIERFYDVSDGSISLNGIDLRNLSQKTLRSVLGYIPQQSFLFQGTIGSNVSYGNESLSAPEINQALDIAQAKEFVASKPDGLQTEISQGGTNVSGGQRQRLSIARAFATDAYAFLFDDSFSALDYKTDSALRAAISEQLSGKTIIIVAQRIATVLNADNIIVLDEGHMVGQGTHEELLKTCEAYREIALSQLSAEELGIEDFSQSHATHRQNPSSSEDVPHSLSDVTASKGGECYE